jgi:SAM-dependent methyltransferase
MTEPSLSAWLALREAADTRARSQLLTARLADRLSSIRPLRILDLGTGTGSNIRYLAPRLGTAQHWLAVDKDPRLLAEVAEKSARLDPDLHVDTRALNLGAMTGDDMFDGRHLVTGSALLDLVSDSWLAWVAANCRRVGAAAFFALTYNGDNICTPPAPRDAAVFALFNQHQLMDKGLGGPAAGPRATIAALRCFEAQGFETHRAASNWELGPADKSLQIELIEGWAGAAAEIAPDRQEEIDAWRQTRLDHARRGESTIVVGHDDILAMPRRQG